MAGKAGFALEEETKDKRVSLDLLVKGREIRGGVNRILVCQLGDIGDVVWSLPALRALKEHYPEARLSLLARDDYGSILEGATSLDRIYPVKSSGNFIARTREQLGLIGLLRKERFDLAIDLRAGDRGAIMIRLTSAPVRLGLYYKPVRGIPLWRNHLFSHLVLRKEGARESGGAAEQSLCILKGLGIGNADPIPKLEVAPGRLAEVKGLLAREGIDPEGGWITINPFSRWSYKEISLGKWEEIIRWLRNDWNLATVIVGAPGERKRACDLAALHPEGTFNLAGKTALAQLPALLSLSRLHAGVDSAACIISASVGTPTVTIWGPSDWREWAVPGVGHGNVVSPLPCVPCFRKGCDDSGRSRCLEELETKEIKRTIARSLLRAAS